MYCAEQGDLLKISGIKYPELIQYLKERRLYVNEMIQDEEEL